MSRTIEWAAPPLAAESEWPRSLRAAVKTALALDYPIIVFWGPKLLQYYNDAYRPILGRKHPKAFGQPARECWPEAWDQIEPMMRPVLEEGRATRFDDQLLLIDRGGFLEEIADLR